MLFLQQKSSFKRFRLKLELNEAPRRIFFPNSLSSILFSKARSIWGHELFEKLFVRTKEPCGQESLIEGGTIHMMEVWPSKMPYVIVVES